MKEYTRQMKENEIGGLLTGKITEEGDFIIENAVLLKQQKSICTFEIDDDAMMELTKNASPRFLKSIIGWWHSHGFSKTFWSTVDDDCFKRLTDLLDGRCFGIVLANRPLGFSTRSRLDFYDKRGKYISIDRVKPKIENDDMVKLDKKSIAREIKRKVRYEVVEVLEEEVVDGLDKKKSKFETIIEANERKHTENCMDDIFKEKEVLNEPKLQQTSRASGYPKF